MHKFISKLRQKPESYRRSFALLFSVALTLVIILVWLSVIFSGNVISNSSKKEGGFSLGEVVSPLDSLKSSFDAAFDSFKGILEGKKES